VLGCIWIGYSQQYKDAVDADPRCNTPIVRWLVVQGALHLASSVKSLITLIMICRLGMGAKRGKDIIDIMYCCSFLNFQVAWLIYGNTFQYSDNSMYCSNNYGHYHKLWILMMISIAFGYLLFVVYLVLICLGSCLVCAICFMHREINLRNNPVVARVPYMNAVASLNKKKFENVDENNRAME